METIEGLAKQASQLTMYDLKSYYTQAKNMVLNVSEMEAKVREATNDDAWGASSTLMQDIAASTNNYAQFNEIMPTIYARFMEKEAREWRQIYKALTLLEYLVKHGSERVVDDARAHVSTIKMLRSFHYIDEKGKDQGINVRNRAQEIVALLGDVEKIRTERRKAKANRNKYQGTGNDGLSFSSGSGGRYGGFGSETVGGARVGSGGFTEGDDYRPRGSTFRDAAAAPRGSFDEYEGADDFDDDQPRRQTTTTSTARGSSSTTSARPPKPVAKEVSKPVEKAKEVNLFDFGDDDDLVAPPAAASAPAVSNDDDFDDFQQAPSAPAAKPSTNANLFDLLNSTSTSIPSVPQPQARQSLPPAQSLQPQNRAPSYSSPNYYGGLTSPSLGSGVSKPSNTTSPAKPSATSTFDDLFATQLSSLGGNKSSNGVSFSGGAAGGVGGKTIQDLEREKAMSKLWGTGPGGGGGAAPGGGGSKPQSSGGAFDDLLL